MPLKIRSGGRRACPCLRATRRSWPPTIAICTETESGSGAHLSRLPANENPQRADLPGKAGSAFHRHRFRARAAIAGNCRLPKLDGAHFFSPDRLPISSAQWVHHEPLCLTPFAAHASGSCSIGGPRDEEGLGIARRVQKALQVPAVRQHKGGSRAEKSCALVAGLPRRDVVRGSADDIGVERRDLFQIDFHALQWQALPALTNGLVSISPR